METVIVKKNDAGFTLIELMIAVVITSVIAMAIYFSYSSQQRIYIRQEAVVDMQQNLRSGLYLLSQELRLAAYDPTGKAGARIVNATSTSIQFTQDVTDAAGTATDGDGALTGPNENITLAFDAVNSRVTRDTGGGPQPFIDNVDFIEFVYTLTDGRQMVNPAASTFNIISTVEISLLVRASAPDVNFLNRFTYTTPNPSGSDLGKPINGGPYNDNFLRRFLYTTVQCRNINL